jgi:hypothetical protein
VRSADEAQRLRNKHSVWEKTDQARSALGARARGNEIRSLIKVTDWVRKRLLITLLYCDKFPLFIKSWRTSNVVFMPTPVLETLTKSPASLSLDSKNPRLAQINQQASERELIEELVLKEDVHAIAKSIVDSGYF